MSDLEARQRRTNEKIKFALIHLEELQEYEHSTRRRDERDGGPWEVAHQESFLFHLLGVLDAFYQELNMHCNLGFSDEKVGKDKFWRALKKHEVVLAQQIQSLEDDSNSWLAHAREMRNHLTHRTRLSRTLSVSTDGWSKQYLKHPRTKQDSSDPVLPQFENWHLEMSLLVTNLRPHL